MPNVSNKKHKVFVAILIVTTVLLCFVNKRYKLIALNSHPEISSSEKPFSILTFNVAAYDSTLFTTTKQKGLLKLIAQVKPDIVCFQEMSFENLHKIKPQLDSIYGPCEVLKGDNQMWRLRFYSHFPLRNFSRHKCDGDISTVDMTEDERSMVEQSQKQMNVMSAEFEVKPGHWVTVFSGHLRSSAYSTARRSMDEDDSWFDGISLYKRNFEVGKRIRDYEADNVRRFVDEARSDSKAVIVAGDLNDWCGSDCLNTLMSNDLKDAWWEGGNGFGWTYSGWNLRLRLDHILYSDDVELVDVKVIDSDLSDHKPLMARFCVK